MTMTWNRTVVVVKVRSGKIQDNFGRKDNSALKGKEKFILKGI